MTLVFTNGCFDLFHAGHTRLLRYASGLGDRLIVGINSDASVRRLKGPSRPIIPERERLELVRSIKGVDSAVIFHEDTPAALIAEIRPSVLVKGPDYLGRQCPTFDFVRSYGGRVVMPVWEIDVSTTSILARIRESLSQETA